MHGVEWRPDFIKKEVEQPKKVTRTDKERFDDIEAQFLAIGIRKGSKAFGIKKGR